MKPFIYFILFLVLLSSCQSYRLRRATAGEQIEQLKNGVLLVRLRTLEGKAAALQEIGQDEEALKVEKEQELQNKYIMRGFSQLFDFCPVYFFYSTHAKQVRAQDFAGVIFDAEGRPVAPEELSNKPYFIAHYGEYDEPGANSVNTELKGVIIRDRDFVQLAPPFPSSASINSFLTGSSAEESSIRLMNTKLNEFLVNSRIRQQKRALKEARKALSN